MMMNKRNTLIALALFAAAALPASAQFGGLTGGGSKAGAPAGDIEANVKGFIDKSTRIESSISNASLAILAAFASEEQRAQLKARQEELSKATDPKEAGAKFQAISESASAEMKKLSTGADLSERTSKLSEQKKKQLADGVTNFLIGSLQAKELAPTGQNLVASASANPMNINKVMAVKDALPRLINATSLAGTTIPAFIKALQGANVKVPEVTATSKQVEITSL